MQNIVTNLITEVSKYVIIIFIAIYAFDCFFVFKKATESKKNSIYIRQNVFMFLIHFVAFAVLCFQTENMELIIFYAFQQVLLFGVMALYRTIYKNINRLLLNNMCMFLSISFIMLTRLSYTKAIRQFEIVLISEVITLAIPYAIKKIKSLRNFGYVYGGLGVALLSIVFILGSVTNGAKLSFSFGGITLQPSEFVKILFVLFVAAMYAKSTDYLQIIVTSSIAALHVLILVLSKDLGGALILFVTYVMMLYVADKNPFYLVAGLLSGSIASAIAYKLFSHVRVRVQAWRDPFSVIESQGYQISQSLFAIGTGGWFGMGLGQGAPTQIPVVDTDFIFSAISEELGGIFALCLTLIYISCFIMFLNVAMQMKDEFYRLVSLGLGIIFGFQMFLTVGGVIKFIPLTGVTLPLVSYGGSSVLSTLIMFAIIQGIYLLKQDGEDNVEEKRKSEAGRDIKKTKKEQE